MNIDRIKEIHKSTAYPDSISVYNALLQVWNECEHGKDKNDTSQTEENDYKSKYEYLIKETLRQNTKSFTISSEYYETLKNVPIGQYWKGVNTQAHHTIYMFNKTIEAAEQLNKPINQK